MNQSVFKWVFWIVCVNGFVMLRAAAQETGDRPTGALGREQWAVLIACEKYQRATNLRYTVNDARRLASTLYSWGGYGRDHLLEITDESLKDNCKPLKANIQSELPKYLKKIGADDVLLVYFSGHGFRDSGGRMYLAPLDIDPNNPAATGIPIEWMRQQIAACKAGFKLLVLDACHAGSEKEAALPGVTSKDLGEPFREQAGVVTLASSTADETSQVWEEKEQSLFSYWLDQGLKGSADENLDNSVDVDELYKFVHRSVRQTAKRRFHREQTPVRIVGPKTKGIPTVLRLKPLTLDQLLTNIAEQLAWAMEESGEARLGVLEFINDTKRGEALGKEFGALGRCCAEKLEQRFGRLGRGKFGLVDQRRLRAALNEQDMSIVQLASAKALKQLSTKSGGMPVLAEGVLRWRSGNIVSLQCKLVHTESDDVLGEAGGAAALNESELGMTGRSFEVEPEDRDLPVELPDDAGPAERQTITASNLIRQQHKHPLDDEDFRIRVWLTVNGRERKLQRGESNEKYVHFAKGEVFEIHVENLTGQVVLMRLLVDGLNTLPEKAVEKGVVEYQLAKPVSLDEARFWVLDPKPTTHFVVRGFVSETGQVGELREFKIVDAVESLAARQQFTDQIGLITAAFYEPTPADGERSDGTRGIGVGSGQTRKENLRERKGFKVGNLSAVVNIHYGGGNELDTRR